MVSSWESKGPNTPPKPRDPPKNKALLGDDLRDKWLFNHPFIVGFLSAGCSRGGGNWGTLRIPGEDWGTLGNIRED